MAKKKSKKKYSAGRYPYKDESVKKKKKKSKKKEQKKADKKLRKECNCNHIASNDGKKHMKKVTINEIDYNVCKICGGRMIADKSYLSRDSLVLAVDQIKTMIDLGRNKLRISPAYDNELVKIKYFVSKIPELHDELATTKKKKQQKKNNKKSKKKGKGKRANY